MDSDCRPLRWRDYRPTADDVIGSCEGNARESARLAQTWQTRWQRCPPGTKECYEAFREVMIHRCNEKHWLQMAEWFRQRRDTPPRPLHESTRGNAVLEIGPAIEERLRRMSEDL